MTNQKRLDTIADLAAAYKLGRFTPTQINKVKVVKQSLGDAVSDLRAQEQVLDAQLRIPQSACPHPFRIVSWTEIIPAGGVRGHCDLCGQDR